MSKVTAFVEVLDTNNDPMWVRPDEIRQIRRGLFKGQSEVVLASGEIARVEMGRTKVAKWIAEVEG